MGHNWLVCRLYLTYHWKKRLKVTLTCCVAHVCDILYFEQFIVSSACSIETLSQVEGTSPIVSTAWSFLRQNLATLVPATCSSKRFAWNFSCDKFLRLVPQNASAVWPLNSWDKSLRPVPSCKLFRGLLAGTSPLVCADLNNWRVLIEKHSVIYRFPCHDLRPLRKRYVKPVTRVRISHLAAFYCSRNFGDSHAQLHNIKTKGRKMKLLGHYIP